MHLSHLHHSITTPLTSPTHYSTENWRPWDTDITISALMKDTGINTPPAPMEGTSINNFFDLGQAKGFKLVHLNVRSLLPKIEQIKAIINISNIDVLTISETWLNPLTHNKLIEIPGYKLFRQKQKFRKYQQT